MTIRPKDQARAEQLRSHFIEFEADAGPLLGVADERARNVLIAQVIESIRRIEYAHFVRDGEINVERANPNSELFDPIRAAVYWLRRGDLDEAFWLIFLQTHFGKDGNGASGWGLVRSVYGALGEQPWTWRRVTSDVAGFRAWLSQHENLLRSRYNFGNHRKYQSLSGSSRVGTGAVVASYVTWIGPARPHREFIRAAHLAVGQDPQEVFAYFYRSMNVMGFGRLGKFDFLTMLGKLGIAPIEPDSAYLTGATGPLAGARLLFANDANARLSARDLDRRLKSLDQVLHVGMQVLEDSLCNWQKSPRAFIAFRG